MIFSFLEIILFFCFPLLPVQCNPLSFTPPPHIFSTVSGRKRTRKVVVYTGRQTVRSSQTRGRSVISKSNRTRQRERGKERKIEEGETGRSNSRKKYKHIILLFSCFWEVVVFTQKIINRSTMFFRLGFDFQQDQIFFLFSPPSHGLPSFFLLLPVMASSFLFLFFPFSPSFCGNQFSSSFPSWRPPKNILATSASVVVFSFPLLYFAEKQESYILLKMET